MGMFKKYLADERFTKEKNTLADYQAAVEGALRKNFPDDVNAHRSKLINESNTKLTLLGIIPPPTNREKLMITFGVKYDEFVDCIDEALQKIWNIENEPPKPPRIQNYDEVKGSIDYSAPTLKTQVD